VTADCLKRPDIQTALRDAGLDAGRLTDITFVEAALGVYTRQRDAMLSNVLEMMADTQQQKLYMGALESEDGEPDTGDGVFVTADPKPIDVVLSLKNTKSENDDLESKVVKAIEAALVGVVDEFKSYRDDTGHLHVSMLLPPRESRAPDTSERLVRELIGMFRDGATDPAAKIPVENLADPTGVGGSGRKLHIHGKTLAVVGKMLAPSPNQKFSLTTRRANVLAALAWLEQRGIILHPSKGQKQALVTGPLMELFAKLEEKGKKPSEASKKKLERMLAALPIPDDQVIGVNNLRQPITWGEVRDAKSTFKSDAEFFEELRAPFTVVDREGVTRLVEPYRYETEKEIEERSDDAPREPTTQEQADDDAALLIRMSAGMRVELMNLISRQAWDKVGKGKEARQAHINKIREVAQRLRAYERAARLLRSTEFTELGTGEQTLQDARGERWNELYIGGSDMQGEGMEHAGNERDDTGINEGEQNRTRGGIREPFYPDDPMLARDAIQPRAGGRAAPTQTQSGLAGASDRSPLLGRAVGSAWSPRETFEAFTWEFKPARRAPMRRFDRLRGWHPLAAAEIEQRKAAEAEHDRAVRRAENKAQKDRRAWLSENGLIFGEESWLAPVMDKLIQILKKLNMGNVQFRLVTTSGLDALEAALTVGGLDTTGWSNNRRTWFEGAVAYNARVIERLRAGDITARMVKLRRPLVEGKSEPVIFVSDKVEPMTRPRVLLHELGHIVLYHQFEALGGTEAGRGKLAQLAKDLGAKNVGDFHERFAELFTAWYFGGQNAGAVQPDVVKGFLADTQLAPGKTVKVLDKLFRDITKALRTLYHNARELFGEAAPATFNAWMKDWLGAFERADHDHPAPTVSRYLSKETMGIEYADFTPVGEAVRNQLNRAARTSRARRIAASLKTLKAEVWMPVYQTLFETGDGYLRRVNLGWLADQFHRRPGQTNAGQLQYGHEMMQQMARWQTRLDATIKKHWPKGWGRQEEPQLLKDAREMLHGRMPVDPKNGVYTDLRAYYDAMHEWLVESGIPVAKVTNYFPVIYSSDKIVSNREQFLQDVITGAADWNASLEAQAQQSADLGPQAVEALLSRRIEDAAGYADELYRKLSAQAETMEMEDGFEIIAPGFAHKKKRVLPKEVRDRLGAYMEDDLVDVTMRYTAAAVRRVAWQKRFGLNEVLEEIQNTRVRNSREGAARAEYFKDFYQSRYNVDIYDPSAGLKVRLLDALRSGEIDQKVYDRVLGKLIPAYQGRLGADMYPTLKRMSAVTIVYQNYRLLAFGIFSQVVDIGTLAARAQSAGIHASEIRRLMAGMNRADLMTMAKAIGAIRDDVTEHVLNDSTDVMSTFRRTRRWNDALFKWNGMQPATHAMRAVALSIGRHVILESASRGPRDAEAVKQLAKLGLTMERAQAWAQTSNEGRGTPGVMDAALEGWGDVYGALNQFVDESVVRPTPMTRPIWGSDQRFAVLWHLKSFMWAFHQMIFLRAWQDTKDANGMMKVMPFMILAAFTLPLAALGMELRWLLAPPKQEPEGGWEYFWEAVQRAGLLGLYQMWADFDDAEDFGRLAILSAAGPTVSQIEEVTTKDFDYWAPRALPLRPVFQTYDNFFGGGE